MNDGLLIHAESEAAARAVQSALTRRGFYVVRSFDLRSALAPLAAHDECECPHHGTAKCTCQFTVLLAYSGEGGEPVVLTTHSREACTQIQIVADATTHPDARLVEKIMAALMEVASGLRVAASPFASMASAPAG